MNYKMMGKFLSQIAALEFVFLIPALVLALCFGETVAVHAFLLTMAIIAAVALLLKGLRRNIRQVLHPRKVQVVRVNGKAVDETVLDNANAYLAAYVAILVLSYLLVSLDNMDIGSTFSGVLACLNNVGPGLGELGPTCNYFHLSDLSKLTLTADMLIGRLEIFPILILFSRTTWKRK